MIKIPLTQGKHTLIDDNDLELVATVKWCALKRKNGFNAVTLVKGTLVGMHRFLMNPPEGYEVDHVDGDGLNNQRHNLRVCTHFQNLRNVRLSKKNTSGFKGVSWRNGRRVWCAKISLNDKTIPLGEYKLKEHAAMAYDYAAISIGGDFALTNAKMGLYRSDLAV